MPKPGSSPRASASKRYYVKHRDEILAKRRKNNVRINDTRRKRQLERYRVLGEIKREAGCIDCGRNDFPALVYDFDHVRGEKTKCISALVANDAAWEDILAEVDKCEIVCSNCHRIRTYERKETTMT